MITINPDQITKFNRTEVELQLFFVFCVLVSNKNSLRTANIVNKMFQFDAVTRFGLKVIEEHPRLSDEGIHAPFQVIHIMIKNGMLRQWLEHWKTGQYTRICKCLEEIHSMRLRRELGLAVGVLRYATVDQLEQIHGIGPKTARFFVVHSRPNQPYAVLDTHVMTWLNQQHSECWPDVYINTDTPTKPHFYNLFETLFLGECQKWNLSPSELDLLIWRYQKGGTNMK
jgi:hypothetical protein